MLVDLKTTLDLAEKGGFAVPAFNIYNMETVMGVINAAEEARSPVILQTYSRLFTNGEAYYLAPTALAAARKASVPVAYHLDHGAGFAECAKAVRYGCTGVMIDASQLPFDGNVSVTKRVCDLCSPLGIGVEGELGHVGTTNEEIPTEFTNADEAKEFAEKTGVCALAVMVGTAHGRYKKAPKLGIDRIREIKEAIGIPVVLHGGSGIPDEEIRAAIKAGIRKVNFGTDLCYSFIDKVMETSRDKIAIDVFMKDAIKNVSEFALSKIKLLGAENRI